MGKANFSDEFKRDAVAQITERGSRQVRVWPDGIVVVSPSRQHHLGMGQRGEQGRVEAFVLQQSSRLLSPAFPGLARGTVPLLHVKQEGQWYPGLSLGRP